MNTLQNAKNKGKIVRIEFSYYGWKHTYTNYVEKEEHKKWKSTKIE